MSAPDPFDHDLVGDPVFDEIAASTATAAIETWKKMRALRPYRRERLLDPTKGKAVTTMVYDELDENMLPGLRALVLKALASATNARQVHELASDLGRAHPKAATALREKARRLQEASATQPSTVASDPLVSLIVEFVSEALIAHGVPRKMSLRSQRGSLPEITSIQFGDATWPTLQLAEKFATVARDHARCIPGCEHPFVLVMEFAPTVVPRSLGITLDSDGELSGQRRSERESGLPLPAGRTYDTAPPCPTCKSKIPSLLGACVVEDGQPMRASVVAIQGASPDPSLAVDVGFQCPTCSAVSFLRTRAFRRGAS